MANQKYRYQCAYTISKNKCDKSFTYGRCCCECEAKNNCEYACLNAPDKCGALLVKRL